MEKPNGKLIFYGDEVPINFPPLYNNFLVLLREILGLEENFLSNIRLSYRDKDEDKIEINSVEAYNIFFEDIKKGKQMTVTIEVKEESNLDIKSCSSSILNYVEKKSGNINNVSEEIKKNSIELNEENNNKENKIDLSENVNNDINANKNNEENSNQLIMNNNINNINNINNNEIDLKEENNNIPQKQNNNINNISNINSINNKNQEQFNNNINNVNNINNSNNINNINIVPQNQNNISQISQNQNMNEIKANKLTNKYLYMLQFPYACTLCRLGPIYRVMYYCKDCNIIICPKCEQREGERHYHPLYKVQNGSQFQYLNINGVSTMDKIMDKMEGAYNSVLGFFGAGGNNNNENNQNNRVQKQPPVPQLISIVQLARNIYDLRNVTDQQIEEALIKTKGNIDEAVFSLVPK